MRRRRDAAPNSRTRTGTRPVRRNRVLALAILALLALASVAPTGQASSSQTRTEQQAQRALQKAERAAEHEAVLAQREATKSARGEVKGANQAQRQVRAEQRAAMRAADKQDQHAVVSITCTTITVSFREFNAVEKSPQQIFEKVLYKQMPKPALTYVFAPPVYRFEGSTAVQEIKIAAPLGESTVGIRAHFSSNGVRGTFNIHEMLTCGPNSQFSLLTSQSLAGPFTTSALAGEVGQTVSYATTARNEGNTPLQFAGFSAPGCDDAAAGGVEPGAAVQPRETVTWYCHHTLTEADRTAGLFASAASVTARPESDPFTSTILHTSAGVLISPVRGTPQVSKGGGGTPEVSTASAPASAPPSKSGVLGFSSSAVPALLGPAKCVRSTFTVSVRSAGVASVVFYLDGHKIARRTAHSAKGGSISIGVQGARLKAGVHHLTATITMLAGSSASKAVVASRARIVRRCRAAKHA